MLTLEQLQKRIQDYIDHGHKAVVEAGVRYAQTMTRNYISRTHPSTGFGGQSLIKDTSNSKTSNQIIKGKYHRVDAESIEAVVYANYLARWYNTGAKQHVITYGPHKGWLSTYYAARGAYFSQNASAIENYFASQLEQYMDRHIKI